jgi:hypothetical protein
MLLLSFIFVIVCCLNGSKRISADFLSLVYMYGRLRSCYQEEFVGILLTCLIPPHLCVCLKPGPWFPTSYVVVFFVFSELRWDVILRFVDAEELFYSKIYFAVVVNNTGNFDFRIPQHQTIYFWMIHTSCICRGLFCVQWIKMRCDSSLCWCWWNCWPLLFKFYFHYVLVHICVGFLSGRESMQVF